MKPTALFLVALLIGCSQHRDKQVFDSATFTNSQDVIAFGKSAHTRDLVQEMSVSVHGLSQQVADLRDSALRGWKTAEYWHDLHYAHLAEVHSGPAWFNLQTVSWGEICYYSNVSSGDVPFVSITMPCGYVWELRWGDKVPETDVPCPCGNPDHWVFKFDHQEVLAHE